MSNLTTASRLDALEGRFDRLEGLLTAALEAKAPAKAPVARRTIKVTPARKPAARKARKAPVRKSVPVRQATQAKGDKTARELGGRKAWNTTFVALVKTSGLRDKRGVSLYRVSQNRWAEVALKRDAGLTPNEAIASIKGSKTWA